MTSTIAMFEICIYMTESKVGVPPLLFLGTRVNICFLEIPYSEGFGFQPIKIPAILCYYETPL